MAWTSNKDSVGALGYPAELVTNNPEKYGIVFADDISGHRQVANLEALYEIPTAILSKSKTTDHTDALGQKWYVLSEGKHYRLKDWNNKANANGWIVDTQAIDRITGVNYTISTPSATTTTRNIKITGINPLTNTEVSSNINIPAATTTTAGVMTADDRVKMNALGVIDKISHIKHDAEGLTYTDSDVTLNYECIAINETQKYARSLTFKEASLTEAGVMSAENYKVAANIKRLTGISHMNDTNLFTKTATDVSINYSCINPLNDDTTKNPETHSIAIGAATTTTAGVMPAADYITTSNLRKLTAISHLNDDALFTTDANNIAINYNCISTTTVLGTSLHSIPIPAATTSTAGVITSSDFIAINLMRKLTAVSHMVDVGTFTTTADTIKFNYACVSTIRNEGKIDRAIDFPIATTTTAGAITAEEKKKLDCIIYANANADITNAGINRINFSSGYSDTAYIHTVTEKDNTKFVINISDNFGVNDTNDIFLVRGSNAPLTSELNVRFQVGKTIRARNKADDALERVLTESDIIPLNNIINFRNISHVNDQTPFTANAVDVKFNYKCLDTITGGSNTHAATIPAVTTTKAGVMTAEDKVNFDELCLLTYGNNTALTMGGSTQTIEKGVNTTVTVSWNATFNGTAITPSTVSVKKGTTELSNSTTTKSLTDTITDSTTYTTTITYRGVTKTASRTYNAYYPKYYGGSAKTTLTSADITALTKQGISSSANGTNNVTCAENQYIWFCVPSTMNINKITMGGFAFPILAAVTVAVTGKGNYKCYRSENLMSAGTRSFVIS